MRTWVTTMVCLLAAAPVGGASMMNDGAAVGTRDVHAALEAFWTERTGTPVPDHVQTDLQTLANAMTHAEVTALRGASEETRRTAGDIWSVCLSASGGCSVEDLSKTQGNPCHQFPVLDHLWVYRTVPSVLAISAAGSASGTWHAYTLETTGTFASATLVGTSCIVIDKPNVVVVRTNGVAEFEQ